MTRLLPRSLAARFIAVFLLALALSQGVGFLIAWEDRGQALRAQAKAEFLSRTASLALLLETTPSAVHTDMLQVSGTAYTRFWISPQQPMDAGRWRKEAWVQLAKPLPTLHKPQPDPQPGPVVDSAPGTAMLGAANATTVTDDTVRWLDLPPHAWPLSRPAKFMYLDTAIGMGLAVRLDNGAWLNAAFAKSLQNSPWASQTALSLAVTAAVLSGIAVIIARGIARPMRRLAAAAEQLGRGETVPPLPESGPDDIRQTAEAFNRMQARLQRFVHDRTRMLAAIGHDLRTPLTSLRLRAEFVTDPELQEKMLNTIAEIQTMTEAALAFAREEATVEETRTVDLSALVESLCDDLADLGSDVRFTGGTRISLRCRPDALRRAIRNLVENAVRYGERARVRVGREPGGVEIVVEDDGPGIPADQTEQVFAPFFRLEHSRNRETGGVGLGLSIARTIARHHGGDVRLSNGDGGLRAVLALPLGKGHPADA
ncbi:HAMP domain-containing protein [Azospirillum sp. RWY-5-1]|uniref:histidine kinase n=1 Tax=Azospirillum oleiclasticum TaxID=2735135 RepID=A0ABX2T9Y1_9PROT|nr:ATP-binding protein [Azospirillum oleiclasticum]NYZ13786.1 HAMP domain-containing protein [Azospirillum oleiclasticum]NYZ21058.1 HAMP domain-containing protein [Azospirillum oleiclasticum]